VRTLLLLCLASCTASVDIVAGDPEEDSVAGAGLTEADTQGAEADRTYIEARVCASGATTLGIDVSYYQGAINWTAVKNAGVKFAFIRLSDGDVFQDPKFAANWNGAKQAGIVRGAYQFFRPNQSVTAQADKMIAAIGTYQPGDLPPVIDVEATGGLGPSAVASRVRTWVDRVKGALGVDPIVYTGKYFWRDQVGGPTSFATNPLWIAQYTSLCPDLPAPWQRWTFWQYTDSGSVSGISGNVDMNRFNGSVADLLAFANSSTMPQPPAGGCTSATLNKDVPELTCVQAASDQKWYRCEGGAWIAKTSTAACAAAYGWCSSATLGRAVPPRTCVQAASDNKWYQCDGRTWASPVDPIAESGPAGLCSATYPR
jgi:GH25 family lysozyme M1 (1,4-beta-N-acetylmuramidase)